MQIPGLARTWLIYIPSECIPPIKRTYEQVNIFMKQLFSYISHVHAKTSCLTRPTNADMRFGTDMADMH